MAYGEGVGVEVSENADSNSWYSLRFFRGVVRSVKEQLSFSNKGLLFSPLMAGLLDPSSDGELNLSITVEFSSSKACFNQRFLQEPVTFSTGSFFLLFSERNGEVKRI